MNPIFVSYFTPNYAEEAAGLIDSLDAHGCLHDVRAVPAAGDWVANCGMKATFIRDRMLDHPEHPVVWVDADARIRQPPRLFDSLECDFAAHWRHGVELLSGTLFFGQTESAWELVKSWIRHQAERPGEWDQKNLQRAVESFGQQLTIRRLPAAYTRIFDAVEMKLIPPVIEHRQASRRLAK